MTRDEAQAVLDRVDFSLFGVQFKVLVVDREDRPGFDWIRLEAKVPDRDNPNKTWIAFTDQAELFDNCTPDHLISRVYRLAHHFATHETDEMFRVDGVRHHDPHNPLNA